MPNQSLFNHWISQSINQSIIESINRRINHHHWINRCGQPSGQCELRWRQWGTRGRGRSVQIDSRRSDRFCHNMQSLTCNPSGYPTTKYHPSTHLGCICSLSKWKFFIVSTSIKIYFQRTQSIFLSWSVDRGRRPLLGTANRTAGQNMSLLAKVRSLVLHGGEGYHKHWNQCILSC